MGFEDSVNFIDSGPQSGREGGRQGPCGSTGSGTRHRVVDGTEGDSQPVRGVVDRSKGPRCSGTCQKTTTTNKLRGFVSRSRVSVLQRTGSR